MKRKKVRKIPRHPFRFKIETENGNTQLITAWAKVKLTKSPVDLELKPEHVRESMRLGGVSNTQTCTMAICAKRHKDWPHPVEGYIDWCYRRAYVVSRVSKDGAPVECYVYNHGDKIAHLNDAGESGQAKLLKILEDEGPRTIHLSPTKRSVGKSRVFKRKRPPRKAVKHLGTGARARFAVAHLGGVKL